MSRARNYQVVYARSVVEFMRREVSSRRVYERLAAYRSILAVFPEVGEVYDPVYEAARPLFPCRWVAVPGTPFALYYGVDEGARRVAVFAIEWMRANPTGRFSEGR